MPRLGERLLQLEIVTADQLAEALRAQVMWGGRLGTNLVELGYATLDQVTTALGMQHRRHAALASHFDRADPQVQAELTGAMAARFSCVPLVRTGERIIIAAVDPLDVAEIEILAAALGIASGDIVQAIVAELRFHYQLERLYQIPRSPRFMRAAGTAGDDNPFKIVPNVDPAHEPAPSSGPAQPAPTPPPTVAEIEIADDALMTLADPPSPARRSTEPEGHRERRTYLRTLADMLSGHPDEASVVARVDRLAIETVAQPAPAATLSSAIREIIISDGRDSVARTTIAAVERFTPVEAAILLVVRGNAAVSWWGFCRDQTPLPAIALPLDQPGLLPAAIRRKAIARGASGNLSAVDFLLLATLGSRYGDLVMAPISIGDFVTSALALVTTHGVSVDGIDAITVAAGAALGRLMRDASR